jgi:hypothetical protein
MRNFMTLAAVAFGLAPVQAHAQGFTQPNVPGQIGQYNRPKTSPNPTVSPYLNLFRGGGDPAINYFGIVRPQMDAMQAFQQIQQQQQMFAAGTAAGYDPFNPLGSVFYQDPANRLQTGHAVSYFNTMQYFPTPGKGGTGGGGGGAAPGGVANPLNRGFAGGQPFFAGTGATAGRPVIIMNQPTTTTNPGGNP